MICPKCGETECFFAGGDTVVNIWSDDMVRVQFVKCPDCGYFGYDYEFEEIPEEEGFEHE